MTGITLISPPEKHLLMEAGDRPNLGILYLAQALKEAGHTPYVSDLNHDSFRTMNEKIDKSYFIAMTTITPFYDWIMRFSEHLKSNYPEKLLIAGGPHATVAPESIQNNFDYIVKGEGERAIVDIVEGKVKDKIIQYPYEIDIDKLPIPHRAMPSEYKYGINQEGHNTMSLLTSRSCPFRCFFCTHGILGNYQRKHSPERVLLEVDELMDKGYNSFYFQDDCFTIDKKRAIEIADRLKERKVTIRVTSRTDTIDEELMSKLRDAGLRSISYGLEHFDNKVLKKIDKDNSVENHIKAIKCAHDNGVKVRGSFIVNLPGATKKTAYKTLEMAEELELEFADFYTLTAYPGTPVWNNPEHYGVKVNKDFKYYQLGYDTNVWTRGFGWKVEPVIKDIRRRWAEFRGIKCPWENCR